MASNPQTPQTKGGIANTRSGSMLASPQQLYAADPKYKKYTQQVEKCLNSFDNVHEWADCIAFLKQLLKTFQSYMQFKEIPRKLVVAKRLSQCLNPALPTGVHQRALEVYAHILAVLGSEGLGRDLPLWSSGLFPFFEYAATSVKPTLLNLYDTHYLPLQEGLRPIMKSFILALLPGLEEETGEFFDKVLGLLDKLSGTVSPSFFFQNIWLVMLTKPSARGSSINFLSRRLPRFDNDEDITAIVGRDIGLMIRAFSAALEDDDLLVRRGALDLLVQSMKLDSAAIVKAKVEDRKTLMRSATGVVLRRDLSLNRRLYTWLLGPAEKSEQQVEYFKNHALGLLKETLREDMFSPPQEYSESRPFKVFVSLQDKWEIGVPLTDAMILDALRAIKKLVEIESRESEDIFLTASTVYEAIEPHIIWRQLLQSVVHELQNDSSSLEAIRMARFVLKTFVHDEETQTIHLPILFTTVIGTFHLLSAQNVSGMNSETTSEGFQLLLDTLEHIPSSSSFDRPKLGPDVAEDDSVSSPIAFASRFYDINLSLTQQNMDDCNKRTPLVTSIHGLLHISTCAVQNLRQISNAPSLSHNKSVILSSLSILGRLVNGASNQQILLDWEPYAWLLSVLEALELQECDFTLLDHIVSVAVIIHSSKSITPPLSIDDRPFMIRVINKLLQYLRPSFAMYHVRAVSLIWSLEAATKHPHVESIIAHDMASSRQRIEIYDIFGALWRLTEDNIMPGFRLKVPMVIILDTLKSEDPKLRRIGETWMRSSLKSYIRVLDPILYDLLDPAIRRRRVMVKVHQKEIPGFLYEQPFDSRYTNHIMETLLSVIRFGGQGFVKTVKGSLIKRANHPGLVQRSEQFGVSSDASYLDVIVLILTNILTSEPKESASTTLKGHNALLQSTAVDLLQGIIARGEVDRVASDAIEAAVVGRLYICVHKKRFDLQNKLLHLLHSLISSVRGDVSQAIVPQQSQITAIDEQDISTTNSAKSTFSVNPLLVQTLLDGVSSRSNRPVLQHWLDFILMALPQFEDTLQAMITPMNECICHQLRASLNEVLQASRTRAVHQDDLCSVTDAELVMFLNALERLVLLGLANASEASRIEDDSNVNEKSTGESSGLLGYVSGVFSSDSAQPNTDEQLTPRSPGYHSLDEGVHVLYSIWASLEWSTPVVSSSKDESLALLFNRTRLRCRRVLEHLFRVQAPEVMESILVCWDKQRQNSSRTAAFELVEILVPHAQSIIQMLSDSICYRVLGPSERRRLAVNLDLSETAIFVFMEKYLHRLEGPIAIQVWGRFMQLTKELTSGGRDFKGQMFSLLKCTCALASKLSQTTAMDDKRLRKELQDTLSKFLDACVTFVGRSGEGGFWTRRARDSMITNGRESPALRDLKSTEKLNASSLSLPDASNQTQTLSSSDLSYQINQFIATEILPNIRRYLVDNDKVAASCTNIAYYIITPALRSRSRPLNVDDTALRIVLEMTKVPVALKSWRTPVSDVLGDNRVFNSTPSAAEQWKPVVKALYDQEKAAMSELLAKVATAPSANIFASREFEMLQRSLNLRRLSYILLSGEKNHFLLQLPTIQEKLVDVLRNVTAPIVQSEVFLCIRVLLCRLSPHNLTSFWPVILTELYRIFEQVMTNVPSDESEELQLIVSASKLLDLLTVLQTEEFQVHQWIFITDTVDAVYRPDNWYPCAMMDQLSEIVGSLPVPESSSAATSDPKADSRVSTVQFVTSPPAAATFESQEQEMMRRPLLGAVRQIGSIRELLPFFSHVSIASYESVYGSWSTVDWDAVEQGIVDDMFDGR